MASKYYSSWLPRLCPPACAIPGGSHHRSAGALHGWRDVRERVLIETEEELPYATTVIVDTFEEGAKLTRISATIFCEREGQKGILIGKKGQNVETNRHLGSPAA